MGSVYSDDAFRMHVKNVIDQWNDQPRSFIIFADENMTSTKILDVVAILRSEGAKDIHVAAQEPNHELKIIPMHTENSLEQEHPFIIDLD